MLILAETLRKEFSNRSHYSHVLGEHWETRAVSVGKRATQTEAAFFNADLFCTEEVVCSLSFVLALFFMIAREQILASCRHRRVT